MEKIPFLGAISLCPNYIYENGICSADGLPTQIPTDQLVKLWVYLSLGALRKKDEKTQWENCLTRWGILQYPYKALGRKHCSAFFFLKI